MSGSGRRFFQDAAIFGAGLLGMSKSLEAQAEKPIRMRPHEMNRGHSAAPSAPLPMATPDVAELQNEMDGQGKALHFLAEPVIRRMPSRTTIDSWRYNGSC